LPIQARIRQEFEARWEKKVFSNPAPKSPLEVQPALAVRFSQVALKHVSFGPLSSREQAVERVKQTLGAKNLGISQVSKITESNYGERSAHFIPQSFYHEIRENDVSPHICQVIALSRITKESLVHWLSVFGFRLDDIPRLQAKLHSERTVVLTSTTYDKHALVPWFPTVGVPLGADRFVPLVQIAGRRLHSESVEAIERRTRAQYLYLKIGRCDALAFPELVPGSICRVDPRKTNILPRSAESGKRHIYAVEHSWGISCSHIDPSGDGRISLVSSQLPYLTKELTLNKNASVLGTVDLEIRPLRNVAKPRVLPFKNLGRAPSRQSGAESMAPLSHLIRASRERLGMHFREASHLAGHVARELQDARYSVAVGSLSDYEASDAVPRHIHKIISLCILYCIDFWTFLAAAGLATERVDDGPASSDKRDAQNVVSSDDAGVVPKDVAPVGDALGQIEEIPLFLQHNLEDVTQLRGLSRNDCFWMGHNTRRLHPLLDGAFLLVVNKKRKRIATNGWTSPWDRPLYLVLKRDGTHVCGLCSLSAGTLTVHPHPDVDGIAERFKLGQDAEVVGQVVCLVRRLTE
jgi:hypothetical protein